MKINHRIKLIFLIILIVLFSAVTIIILKVLKINDSTLPLKEITFDFDSKFTYKKSCNSLPYCLDPLKKVNVNKKSSEKKYQCEILNFLKQPLIKPNSEPKIENKDGCTEVTFEINQNLIFENGEKINTQVIHNTIKHYLDHNKNEFSSENKSFYWLLKLKNANYYYFNRHKKHENKKLNCFELIDDFKFTLLFYSEYVQNENGSSFKNWIDNLVLLPSQYENNFQNYGTPQNNFVSYGEYKVKTYTPNQGLLLEIRNHDNRNIKNIFYRVIIDEQKKIDEFNSGNLNELELTSEPQDKLLKFFPIPISNNDYLLALFLNQGDRNDASFHSDENIKKAVPAIIRDENFKKALIKLIQKHQDSDFIKTKNISEENKKIYSEIIPEEINVLLAKAYDEWQKTNLSQSILVLELICEDEPHQKSIAFFLKQQIEQNLNSNIKDKIKIEVKYFPLYTDITLAEFQCVYDLIITNCRAKDYFSLLEKINLSDLITFKLEFSKNIGHDKIEAIKNQFKLPNNLEFNTLEIQQLYESCSENKSKVNEELNKELLISLQTCLQETIEKNKSFLPLSKNQKYIVYQTKNNELFHDDDILELFNKINISE